MVVFGTQGQATPASDLARIRTRPRSYVGPGYIICTCKIDDDSITPPDNNCSIIRLWEKFVSFKWE